MLIIARIAIYSRVFSRVISFRELPQVRGEHVIRCNVARYDGEKDDGTALSIQGIQNVT